MKPAIVLLAAGSGSRFGNATNKVWLPLAGQTVICRTIKNAHARSEYAIDYTIKYMSEREAFGTKINKFQALRHTMVEHATDVEHCKIFNYAAVARLNKGEYVVKEATMAKLKSTKVVL